jgi:hypothetical protein
LSDETKNHSRVTPEGRLLGFQTARLTEPAVARLVAEGEADERCKSCAGTYGTVPNGCLQTQADFVKAVVEGVPFLCHQADRKGWPCHAWYAARVATKGAPEAKCPWEFSPDPREGAQPPP